MHSSGPYSTAGNLQGAEVSGAARELKAREAEARVLRFVTGHCPRLSW